MSVPSRVLVRASVVRRELAKDFCTDRVKSGWAVALCTLYGVPCARTTCAWGKPRQSALARVLGLSETWKWKWPCYWLTVLLVLESPRVMKYTSSNRADYLLSLWVFFYLSLESSCSIASILYFNHLHEHRDRCPNRRNPALVINSPIPALLHLI